MQLELELLLEEELSAEELLLEEPCELDEDDPNHELLELEDMRSTPF